MFNNLLQRSHRCLLSPRLKPSCNQFVLSVEISHDVLSPSSLHVSLSLCFSVCISLSLCISLCFSVCFSVSFSVYISIYLCVSVSMVFKRPSIHRGFTHIGPSHKLSEWCISDYGFYTVVWQVEVRTEIKKNRQIAKRKRTHNMRLTFRNISSHVRGSWRIF